MNQIRGGGVKNLKTQEVRKKKGKETEKGKGKKKYKRGRVTTKGRDGKGGNVRREVDR